MNRILLPIAFCCLIATRLFAADNLLHDPDFSQVGHPDSAWKVIAETNGKAESTLDADGKTPALHLKAAEIDQPVALPAGDYELTVQAHGGGELILSVYGERTQMLGKEKGTYGYLFHTDGEAKTVIIRAPVDGIITSAALLPASEEQKAALKAESDSMSKLGYISVSAQRPSPAVGSLSTVQGKPLAAMTQRVVFDEPRMNVTNVAHVDRLVDWLGSNGFKRLDGEKLPEWMAEHIRKGDAYGSVVVMARGISPIKFFDGPRDNKPLWLEYLRAGGRIVHIGDVPFNYGESPTGEASKLEGIEWRGLVILGLNYNWNSPYDGHAYPVTATDAAKAWGLENADGAVTGVPVENISVAFHVYTVPSLQRQGASDYFRNLRPDLPWSGLVKILQGFDGSIDLDLRDAWRAANYVGHPVTIPPLPPPFVAAAPSKLHLLAGGLEGRHEFVRGEEVAMQVAVDDAVKNKDATVQLDLVQNGKTLFSDSKPVSTPSFVFKTAPYADGAYELRASIVQAGATVEKNSEKIGIRYLAPNGFNFGVEYQPGGNSRRTELELKDLNDVGMEFYTGELAGEALDAVVRSHIGFTYRAIPDLSQLDGRTLTFEKDPQYFKMGADGKPITSVYSQNLPEHGFTHPDILADVGRDMTNQIEKVAQLPSFRPFVLTNDDYSQVYGWDYAPRVKEAFKAATGLDAPTKKELPANFGAIPDNNPWVQWYKWTLINVDGAFNKVETEAAVKVRPDIKIGPIPGGMCIPFISLDEPSQYPPYNFGKNGFNLICSYYYNSYWQPAMTTTWWMEIGRMGNRDMPEWNMPDVLHTGGYTRNQFYHYLAGGVQGLIYFDYSERTASSWKEIKRLGAVVHRIGPVQMELKPARRDIGMLSSFSTLCFTGGSGAPYAYANLVQAHFSVDMVDEEEVLDGKIGGYKAILLYDVKYLRQSVYDALAKYAAQGGLVLVDSSVPFDIPGAKRLPIDTGMGIEKILPHPPGNAHISEVGITSYGHPAGIEVVRKAISEYVKPQFESPDIKLASFEFASGGVPYTWFVNVQDDKEYDFCRPIVCDRHTPAQMKQLQDWETSEMAKGPYTTTVEYKAALGVPYDLVAGKKLTVAKTASGQDAVTISMDRFGGALVAWLPAELAGIKLSMPKTVSANQEVHLTTILMAKDKPVSATVPVEFVLRDPNGRKSIVSGVRASKEGQAVFAWTPAVNDPVGAWTVEATELASGKKANDKIILGR